MGAVVFVLTLALTSGALAVLHGLDAAPSRALELAVLVVASTAATVTRYVALRTWVFRVGFEAAPAARANVNGGWVGVGSARFEGTVPSWCRVATPRQDGRPPMRARKPTPYPAAVDFRRR